MRNRILAIILGLVACTFSAYANKTEARPEQSKPAIKLEQPTPPAKTAPNAQKELPLAKTPQGWTDSLKKALTQARAENKYIMALFTGSDWCHYCTLLDEEVFNTKEFKDWAEDNVVKLYLDFPQEHRLPPNIANQNIALLKRLGIAGYPTVLFFTPQGQPLTNMGYVPGGGANWVKQVELLLPKTLKTESSLTEAISDSAVKNIPLLLAIYDSKSSSSALAKENIDQVLSTPALALPSGKEIILAKLDYQNLNSKEKALLKNVSSSDQYPKYILLNSNREALFSSAVAGVKPAEIADKVATFIHKPPYDGKWIQDYSEGLKLARLYNKPLLLFFTGSDWCGYCEEMQKNIFQTAEFAEKAKDYILVELDYPRETELPENIRMQNEVILDAFNIQGFPTVVVEKSNGMPIGGVGYSQDITEFFKAIEKSLNNS